MSQSARALFRATGKKAKPKQVRLFDGSYSKAAIVEREKDEFYPTPPHPTQSLLYREQSRLKDFDAIWEPACGDGAMMREISAAGFSCMGSDLVDRGCGAEIVNFFDVREAHAKAIITNPPYNLVNARDGKGRWIWHALDVLNIEYMALLLNWSWAGAAGNASLWAAHPPSSVYLMRWKIDFTGEGSPPMLHGWFCWDRKHTGECQLLMMDRVDGRQGALFGATP